jgi:hypothetical protein
MKFFVQIPTSSLPTTLYLILKAPSAKSPEPLENGSNPAW